MYKNFKKIKYGVGPYQSISKTSGPRELDSGCEHVLKRDKWLIK